MSGLTMLRLLLLMHFVLFGKCQKTHGTQPEEDFGALYDVTASTAHPTDSSWRDLLPNITPTVNDEGAREKKDPFDNGDSRPDLLTSPEEPDGVSSATDYDYASNEYVTTDSKDLLTSNKSLLTVKWDGADVGGSQERRRFTKENFVRDESEEGNTFEKMLTNTILPTVDENHTKNTNLLNDTETANIDSVESIFEDLKENATNSEDAIVDVDHIFSNGDQYSTAEFPLEYSTVNSMDFHDLFALEPLRPKSDQTEEESSGDESLTSPIVKDYFPETLTNKAPSLFDADGFDNIEESSGDEPSTTESKKFDFYEEWSGSGSAKQMETEEILEDFINYMEHKNSDPFGDGNEVQSTRTVNSENAEKTPGYESASSENESRLENTGNPEMSNLERAPLNQLGYENLTNENEEVSIKHQSEVTSETNLDLEMTSGNDFMSAQTTDVYKSTSQREEENVGLKSAEDVQEEKTPGYESVSSENESRLENTGNPEMSNLERAFLNQLGYENLTNENEEVSIKHQSEVTSETNLDLEMTSGNDFRSAQTTDVYKSTSQREEENLGLKSAEDDQEEHLTIQDEQSNVEEEQIKSTSVYNHPQTNAPDSDMPTTTENESVEAFELTTETDLEGETKKMNKTFVENYFENFTSPHSYLEMETETNFEDDSRSTTEIFTVGCSVKEGEKEMDMNHTFSIYPDVTYTYILDAELQTTPRIETRRENTEDLEITEGTSLKPNTSGNDEERYIQTISTHFTDSDLSTTSSADLQTKNTETIIGITAKTAFEDKPHRMPKKLFNFVQDAKGNIENSVNDEENEKKIIEPVNNSWNTQKNLIKTEVPELEFHGEYVYTDVDISKRFDGTIDQNFIEYGEDIDETESVSHIEYGAVAEKNQIEQAFTTEEFSSPKIGKEEETILSESTNEKTFTTDSFKANSDSPLTEERLIEIGTTESEDKQETGTAKTEEKQFSTTTGQTDVSEESERKTMTTSKLKIDFHESNNINSFDFVESISSPTTEIFEDYVQESHGTAAIVETVTTEAEEKQSPITTGEIDITTVKEREEVRSKHEDDFDESSHVTAKLDVYMESTPTDFEKNLNELENKLYDQHLVLSATPVTTTTLLTTEECANSDEIQTIAHSSRTTLKQFKNSEESTSQTMVEDEDKGRNSEGFTETVITPEDTTIISENLNTDIIAENITFNNNEDDTSEFATEKISISYETETITEATLTTETIATYHTGDYVQKKVSEPIFKRRLDELTEDFTERRMIQPIKEAEGDVTALDLILTTAVPLIHVEATNFRSEDFEENVGNLEYSEEEEDKNIKTEITQVEEPSIENLATSFEDKHEESSFVPIKTTSVVARESITEQVFTVDTNLSLNFGDSLKKEIEEEDSTTTNAELKPDQTNRSIDSIQTMISEENFSEETHVGDSLKKRTENKHDTTTKTEIETDKINTMTTDSLQEITTEEVLKNEIGHEDKTTAPTLKAQFEADQINTTTTESFQESTSRENFSQEIGKEDNTRINASVVEIEADQINALTIAPGEWDLGNFKEEEESENYPVAAFEVKTENNLMTSVVTDSIQEETVAENFSETNAATAAEATRAEENITRSTLEVEDQEDEYVNENGSELQATADMGVNWTLEETITTSTETNRSSKKLDNLREEASTIQVETEAYLITATVISAPKEEIGDFILQNEKEDEILPVTTEIDEEWSTDRNNAVQIQASEETSTVGLEVKFASTQDTTVITILNEEISEEETLTSTANSLPGTWDFNSKNTDDLKNEKQDKNISSKTEIEEELSTETNNGGYEGASEETSTVTLEANSASTQLGLMNSEGKTESEKTVEEEENRATWSSELLNEVEVETNGRFLNPQLHLDETTSDEEEEEEENHVMKEEQPNQVLEDKRRNENVQLDSPVTSYVKSETATEKLMVENTIGNHQGPSTLNKSGKIFEEMSKRIFQKYIDAGTNEENVLYKGVRPTEKNYIVVDEDEEDQQMVDDEWIQTNHFIRKIKLPETRRASHNVNKTIAGEWEIVFDHHRRASADGIEVIVAQKRDVTTTEASINDDNRRKIVETLEGTYLNLDLCSARIEKTKRNCLISGSLSINITYDGFTTYIPATARMSASCDDQNHTIDINWVVNKTASGLLSLQLHTGEVFFWISSVYHQLNLPGKKHAQISVSDLVILETQVGYPMQGKINITSTSDLQILIHVVNLASTIVDSCTTKEANVLFENKFALIIGGAALATILVLAIAVFLLYKKFRTTASVYKMAIE